MYYDMIDVVWPFIYCALKMEGNQVSTADIISLNLRPNNKLFKFQMGASWENKVC